MCDLIDLNSPDVKGLLDPKLASPLIPVPTNIIEADGGTASQPVTEKRESMENNPFDMVLHETTEYIRRKGDPFEVMLERALRSKGRKVTGLRAQSVDFADDFTPRRKKYTKKMNKTLDESFSVDKSSLCIDRIKSAVRLGQANVDLDASNAEIIRDKNVIDGTSVPVPSPRIIFTNADSYNSSILNYSAMNDTLSETVIRSKEDREIPIFPEIDTLSKKFVLIPDASLKSLDLRRSLSQGYGESPRKLQYEKRRSLSTTDASRKASHSDNSAMLSLLDKAFLESKQSVQSVFSNLSNVSSITKSNSSATSPSTSVLSNGVLNNAFLDSVLSRTRSNDKINTTENFIERKLMQYDLPDLVERLDKLKCITEKEISASDTTNNINGSDFLKEESNKHVINDKLIDVDVFVPRANFNNEHNKSSISVSSSDSIFVDNSKIDKSILKEAKALSRTFEELALKTDSGSSTDDLISNSALWISELVPAFEDEVITDNLIELPVSPEKNVKESENDNKTQSSTSIDNNMKDNSLKRIESQFTHCIPAERQTILTTLLLDLKGLVKAENNTEANKLLDNLENVLRVKWQNNTELLTTFLTNDVQTNKLDNKLDTEKSSKANADKSKEDNKKISEEEMCNNENLHLRMNHESKGTPKVTTASSKHSPIKISTLAAKDNNENHPDITNSPEITPTSDDVKKKNNKSDEKLVMELLVNLGKLLGSQVEDTATLHLLKNVGKTLNFTSTSNTQTHSSVSTKTASKQSSKSKSKTYEKTTRRSISVIHSPPKSATNAQIFKHKEVSQLKKAKKRFSSDPEFITTVTDKKMINPETFNTKKAEVAEFDTRKEKPIAIIDVKSKLKKKSQMANKKGPLKAVHPMSSMQKRASIGRQTAPSIQAITPPKSDLKTIPGNKITSSTPNSVDNKYMPRKVVKSKPVASSTPDGQNSEPSNVQLLSANSSRRRNFSCDISPVATCVNINVTNECKNSSPTRSNKLPTPRKCTPKRQRADPSGIPKYSTPPSVKKYNSSPDMNHRQVLLESPQRLNKNLTSYQRYSPIFPKRNAEKVQQSPLNESTKLTAKVKPFNLVPKLKRHSTSDFTEKENNYI